MLKRGGAYAIGSEETIAPRQGCGPRNEEECNQGHLKVSAMLLRQHMQ